VGPFSLYDLRTAVRGLVEGSVAKTHSRSWRDIPGPRDIQIRPRLRVAAKARTRPRRLSGLFTAVTAAAVGGRGRRGAPPGLRAKGTSQEFLAATNVPKARARKRGVNLAPLSLPGFGCRTGPPEFKHRHPRRFLERPKRESDITTDISLLGNTRRPRIGVVCAC
jgi:hypothetical protein